MKITPEIIEQHGLSKDEYDRIVKILRREPNLTELGIFSVMWSEHCSYKNSRLELKKLPRNASFVLVKAGEENAGIVEIGNGWAVAFKIESHNHPSAVEPFQGAATGVGGIIRDIFTMGARPILCMNSLRFGPIDGNSAKTAQNRRLVSCVVAGIAHYGNCIGVPTVGGEIYFDECYETNPLVNVLCLGVLRADKIQRAKATHAGHSVMYVGNATGRDGLAGAAFASRELTENSHEDRPAVQVADPFTGKILLEACLEAMNVNGLVVGIQDMGAAGLTCSTSEMASRGHRGIEIDVEKVPQREPEMTPREIMLSESQERMLLIVKKGRQKELQSIFRKWDLHAVNIGRVTADGNLRVKSGAEIAAEIPAVALTDGAPACERDVKQPESEIESARFDLRTLPEPQNCEEILQKLLASPVIASKNWAYRQYDFGVQNRTVVRPGSDAAVIRIPEADKFIAVTTDGNATYCQLDPFEGAKIAVAEAARNLVCSGAWPLAVTNCLNFGNPTNPEVYWQFRWCIEGIAEACDLFDTPVTGGNVSFYNESPSRAIAPTPVIGMIGLIEDPAFITTQWFKNDGDVILLLGKMGAELGGSEYLKQIHGLKTGRPPHMDLEFAQALHDFCLRIIQNGLVKSAHDCSEGGLAVALAECCISNGNAMFGAEIDLRHHENRLDGLLFGETQSRILVSATPENAKKIAEIADEMAIPCTIVGKTGGKFLKIHASRGPISWEIERLRDAWWNSIARLMER
jgi:phosphoribosylformylglycinamidine synthase II